MSPPQDIGDQALIGAAGAGGGAGCFESWSYQNSVNSQMASWCSTRDLYGIVLVAGSELIGKVITSVEVKVKKNGSGTTCTSDLTSRIVADGTEGSDIEDAIATSTNTIVAGTLADGDVITFTYSGSDDPLEEDNGILIHASNTSSCMDCWSNYYTLKLNNSSTADQYVFRTIEWGGGSFEVHSTSSNLFIKVCYT